MAPSGQLSAQRRHFVQCAWLEPPSGSVSRIPSGQAVAQTRQLRPFDSLRQARLTVGRSVRLKRERSVIRAPSGQKFPHQRRRTKISRKRKPAKIEKPPERDEKRKGEAYRTDEAENGKAEDCGRCERARENGERTGIPGARGTGRLFGFSVRFPD